MTAILAEVRVPGGGTLATVLAPRRAQVLRRVLQSPGKPKPLL